MIFEILILKCSLTLPHFSSQPSVTIIPHVVGPTVKSRSTKSTESTKNARIDIFNLWKNSINRVNSTNCFRIIGARWIYNEFNLLLFLISSRYLWSIIAIGSFLTIKMHFFIWCLITIFSWSINCKHVQGFDISKRSASKNDAAIRVQCELFEI